MRHSLTAMAMIMSAALPASGEEIPIGIELGFTGPIESMAPAIAAAAELALQEMSDSGLLLGGNTLKPVRADSTCLDSQAANSAAERLVAQEQVRSMIGPDCSGATMAVLNSVAIPNGMLMISPAATSPALSDIDDGGLFFRTAPSDARQGEVMADILSDRGIQKVAVTYTGNDYGRGLAMSFQEAFEENGGSITMSAQHDDGRADYSSEVAALAAAGGDALVVIGYVDQGGVGILSGSINSGAFSMYALSDAMWGEKLSDTFGTELNGAVGQRAGSLDKGAEVFAGLAAKAGFDGHSTFAAESYDAAALIGLAMQAAKSSDPSVYKEKVMEVANAPGEVIGPGELAKGLQILADGGDINYQGASGVELVGGGDSAGSFAEMEIVDGKMKAVNYR